MNSFILALETCTPVGGVGLYSQDGTFRQSVVVDSPKAQSVEIAEAVARLMTAHSIRWENISAVAVSTGPGSFTGVRLGLSLAKGICLTGAPRLVEVPTLQALALRSLELVNDHEPIVALLNAKKGEAYGQIFVREQSTLIPKTEPFVATPEDFAELFAEVPHALFTGAGSLEYRVQILGTADQCRFTALELIHPHPETVGILGWGKVSLGEFIDPSCAAPFYLREASVSTPKKSVVL